MKTSIPSPNETGISIVVLICIILACFIAQALSGCQRDERDHINAAQLQWQADKEEAFRACEAYNLGISRHAFDSLLGLNAARIMHHTPKRTSAHYMPAWDTVFPDDYTVFRIQAEGADSLYFTPGTIALMLTYISPVPISGVANGLDLNGDTAINFGDLYLALAHLNRPRIFSNVQLTPEFFEITWAFSSQTECLLLQDITVNFGIHTPAYSTVSISSTLYDESELTYECCRNTVTILNQQPDQPFVGFCGKEISY